jgi:hypothetical protein
MVRKLEKTTRDSRFKIFGKYLSIVIISWVICCYFIYAFVSSIGIPLLSDPNPAVPLPLAALLCVALWAVTGFVAVKFFALRWYKVFFTILLSIVLFTVALVGPSEYKEYQKRQLPKRAAEHADAIMLHQGMIDAKNETNGDIYLTFLVPFEVTKEVSSYELPYLFESVPISQGYMLSPKKICNEELYISLTKGDISVAGDKLLGDFTFLDLKGLKLDKNLKVIATISPIIYDYRIPTKYSLPETILKPGILYYIYNGLYIKSQSCTANDFINGKVTTSFIKIKK